MAEQTVIQNVTGDYNQVAGGNINNYAAPPPADRPNLLILLGKVKSDWIDDSLKQSLSRGVCLEVGLSDCGAEVQRPWDSIRDTVEKPKDAGVPAKSIVEIYDATGRAMLILGEPGSGKTIALLKLTQALVAREDKDVSEPVPAVLNLSTWNDKAKGFFEWLADELCARYRVGHGLAEKWLRQGQLTLLLDGLDEVQPGIRSHCVKAINSYLKEYPAPGFVVCSRTAEYRAMDEKLRLNGAVMLQGLPPAEAKRYLEQCGPALEGLRNALETDPDLQELASSPLMLHIMVAAYEAREKVGFDTQTFRANPRRQDQLLEAYVESVFERREGTAPVETKEQTLFWLRWLADKARRQSKTILSLEQLQPAWLETKAQKIFYLLFSRFVVGVLGGLMARYLPGCSTSYELTVVLIGTLVGVIDVSRLILFPMSIEGIAARIVYIGGVATCFAVIWTRLTALIAPPIPQGIFVQGLFWGAIYGTFFWVRSRSRDLDKDIRTVEVVHWSWRAAWETARWWAAIVVILCVALLARKIDHPAETNVPLGSAATILASGLGFALIFVIVALLLGGLKSGIREAKGILNQGIALTLKNSVKLASRVGLACFAMFCALSILATLARGIPIGPHLADILRGCAWWSINVGSATLVGFGGIDVVDHYVLRLQAWALGFMPLRYGRFLNYASKLRLLQRVGGSYVFIHRLLREHLAAQYEPKRK